MEGFRVTLVDEGDLYNWEVAIFGPPNTYYEGGYFKVSDGLGGAATPSPAPRGPSQPLSPPHSPGRAHSHCPCSSWGPFLPIPSLGVPCPCSSAW